MSKIKHMTYNGRRIEYMFNPIDTSDTIVFYNHEMYSFGHGMVSASSLYHFVDMIRLYDEFREGHKMSKYYSDEEITTIKKLARSK